MPRSAAGSIIGFDFGQATSHGDLVDRTTAADIEHILAKLGMDRRTEIAAWTAARPVLHSGPHGTDREE